MRFQITLVNLYKLILLMNYGMIIISIELAVTYSVEDSGLVYEKYVSPIENLLTFCSASDYINSLSCENRKHKTSLVEIYKKQPSN